MKIIPMIACALISMNAFAAAKTQVIECRGEVLDETGYYPQSTWAKLEIVNPTVSPIRKGRVSVQSDAAHTDEVRSVRARDGKLVVSVSNAGYHWEIEVPSARIGRAGSFHSTLVMHTGGGDWVGTLACTSALN